MRDRWPVLIKEKVSWKEASPLKPLPVRVSYSRRYYWRDRYRKAGVPADVFYDDSGNAYISIRKEDDIKVVFYSSEW